jgi:hypothetical protein
MPRVAKPQNLGFVILSEAKNLVFSINYIFTPFRFLGINVLAYGLQLKAHSLKLTEHSPYLKTRNSKLNPL